MSSPQRVAIVTGGARGIGAGISARLAADGMAVAVIDLDEAACGPVVEAITAGAGRAIGIGLNVSDEAGVAAAVQRVTAELGAPTVLVNNAGIIRDNVLQRMSTDDWDAVMAVHLRAPFLLTRALRPAWVEAKWGRVVNLSSTSALGNVGQANYAAAKAGVIGLTKACAKEMAARNIRVNAVAPGFIETAMTDGIPEKIREGMIASIPMGRMGQPEDIARAVCFLASDDASYITGQVLVVDGGLVM